MRPAGPFGRRGCHGRPGHRARLRPAPRLGRSHGRSRSRHPSRPCRRSRRSGDLR
ncbi:hypothetical protein STXM2123_4962 [Streptomyces sp. F-3]|nr:hypothetical protein STXM2123_4962 [Streptomyces sp. F-3]